MFRPRARAPETLFAAGASPRTWGELLSDAAALAEVLKDGSRELIVACGDRYWGAVALLATWRAGRVAALPPNGRSELIDALATARGISLILHDGAGPDGATRDPRALDVRERLAGAPAVEPSSLAFSSDQTLACVYTSGSTGAPLACPKTAAQLLGEAEMLVRFFELGPDTRVLSTVPPHHIYGLLFGTLVPFMGGGALVRATPLHAETIAAVARAEGANVLCSVPAHLRGLAELAPGALSGLRHIFSSAAPLDPATAARVVPVFGRGVTEILGSTETGGIAQRVASAGTSWQTLPGVQVEADDEGTMSVRSPFVSTLSTAAAFQTADRIHVLPDGRFEFLGRGDGVVKIGGTRVSAAEIEARLRALPGVTDAAVLAVAVGGARGHELWAAVAPASLDVAALRRGLVRHVEAVAVPRRFRVVAALPREDSGKLSRDRLSALFAPRARPPVDAPPVAAPRREVHTKLVPIPTDWSYFEGHFDEFPILAGVVQMTAIVLPGVTEHWPQLGPLRRILGLKFRSPIAPGDTLELEVALTAPQKVSFALRRRADVMSSGVLEFGAPHGRAG